MPIGDDAPDPLSKIIDKDVHNLQNEIIKAVIKQAAFQMGVSIALMFVPVIGQAISGLMSLITFLAGRVYQKMMTQYINSTMASIQKRGADVQEQVTQAANNVYMQELPAGRELAMNGQPLGDFWSNLVKKPVKFITKTVPKQITHIVRDSDAQTKFLVDISTGGIRPLVKAVLTGTKEVAKVVESTGAVKEGTLTKPLSEARNVTDDVLYSAEKLVSPLTSGQEATGLAFKYGGSAIAAVMDATGNEKGADYVRKGAEIGHAYAQDAMDIFTPTGAYDLTTGRESYLAAKQACDRMKADAFAQLDATAKDAIAKLQSPEGRQAMRVSIAKALRDDPVFIDQMRQLQELEAQYQQGLTTDTAALESQVGTIQPPSNALGTSLGVAAATAAAVMLVR